MLVRGFTNMWGSQGWLHLLSALVGFASFVQFAFCLHRGFLAIFLSLFCHLDLCQHASQHQLDHQSTAWTCLQPFVASIIVLHSQQRLPLVTAHFRRLFRRLFPSFHGLFLSRYLYNGGSLTGDAHGSNHGGHSAGSSHLDHSKFGMRSSCLGCIPSRRPCLSQRQFPRPRTAWSCWFDFRNLRPSYGSFRPWLWLSFPVSCLLVY